MLSAFGGRFSARFAAVVIRSAVLVPVGVSTSILRRFQEPSEKSLVGWWRVRANFLVQRRMDQLKGWLNGDHLRELRGLKEVGGGRLGKKSFMVPSPAEVFDKERRDRLARTKLCTDKGVQEGSKAAVVATVIASVPTILICRTVPWAKANLNYTAQALVISAAAISTYFIVCEQTIMECCHVASKEAIAKNRAKQS